MNSHAQQGKFTCAQVVHFVRHGEGYHNLIGDYQNWDYMDAHLTPAGWEQVRDVDCLRELHTMTCGVDDIN